MEWDAIKLEAFKKGEESVFKEIVSDCQHMVYNTALSIVQDATEAEDIAQEVFIKMFENAGSFRMDSKISTWLYRITVNKSIDQVRKKKRSWKNVFQESGGQGSYEAAHFDHPGIKTENKNHAAALFAALKKLPERQNAVFVLQQVENRSVKEIAEIIGSTVMTVESLLIRARNNLRIILKAYYEKEIK